MRHRVLARAAARLLLVAWFAGSVLPAMDVHGAGGSDAACGVRPVVVGIGSDASHVHGATPATAPDHCAICHLQRAVRGALAVAPQSVWRAADTSSHLRTTDPDVRAASDDALPARAPPV